MDGPDPVILSGFPPTKIIGRVGRPKGSGCNVRLLAKLKPGDVNSCIFDCTRRRMNSIRTSALQQGIKTKVRRLEGGLYAIWRLT